MTDRAARATATTDATRSPMSRRQLLGGAAVAAAALAELPAHAAIRRPEADELARLDATGSAELVRRRQISPRELVEAAIHRIEAINPRLNAVISTRYERALKEASDPALADGPFRGVPMLFKDVAVEGEPFYHGSRVYQRLDWRPPYTEEFVRRCRRSGMVALGRTNIPEFIVATTTESDLHGPCRNPWNPERSVGGSSGGSAAAVAALLVPVAQGSDGGGSVRIPASATGTFGMKVSRGRIPLAPRSAVWMDFTSTRGWQTRTVRDFAGLLDVSAGPAREETLSAPAPTRPFAREVGAPTGRLRIGFWRKACGDGDPLHPESIRAVEAAAKLLESLGHHVEEAAPPQFASGEFQALTGAYLPLKVLWRASEAEAALGRALTANDLERSTYALYRIGQTRTLADFSTTLNSIDALTQGALRWWASGYDILLTPTTGRPPIPLGLMAADYASVEKVFRLWGNSTAFANLTGLPACSVPLHWTADGMPIGVQLFADIWRDDLLIRLASQLEEASPWRDRIPPLHA